MSLKALANAVLRRGTLRDAREREVSHRGETHGGTVTCMPAPCAWRLYLPRLDRELWVCRDAAALGELEADAAAGGLPVLMTDDVERLRHVDELTLNAVLDTCANWPGCRVVDALPNAGAVS